jgi:hypothetical protein
MPNWLQNHLESSKKRHPLVFLFIGGLLIFLDNIGRAQVIRDMYQGFKMWLATVNVVWPAHLLTWVGAAIVILSGASLIWTIPVPASITTANPKREPANVPPIPELPPVPPKPTHKLEEPKRPNFIFLAGTTTRIRDGKYASFHEAEGKDLLQNDPYAVIASFRNEPVVGKRVASVYARACIVFRNASGEEIGAGISEACWLGDSTSPTVEFSVGESHKVILALFSDGTLLCPYRRITHNHWGQGIETEHYRLDKDALKTIEVRIVHREELLLEPIVFDFSIIDGRPAIKR